MRGQLARVALIAALLVALDRASKIWVVERMGLAERLHIRVLDPYLNFAMAWNEGVNFGLLDFGDRGRWFLIGLAVAIIAGLLVWVRGSRGWGAAAGVGLLVGGAIGNVWDRLTYGAVADFINVSCCGIRNPFAFNFADAAIFLGAVLLILLPRR